MTAAAIAKALGGRRCGRGFIACRPGHKDRNASLSINERDGELLVKCHAACSHPSVIAALRGRGSCPEHPRRDVRLSIRACPTSRMRDHSRK